MTELETKLAEALRATFKILLDDVQGISTEEFDGCDWCDGMESHEDDCDGMESLETVNKAGDLLAVHDAAKAKEECRCLFGVRNRECPHHGDWR